MFRMFRLFLKDLNCNAEKLSMKVFKRRRNKKGRIIESTTFYGRYKLDGAPSFVVVNLKCTDKQVAFEKLRAIVREEERERAGLGVSRAERECLKLPLSVLIDGYVSELIRLGRTHEHIRHIESRLNTLAKDCGWGSIRDMSGESFCKWRKGKQISAKTLNEYQNAVTSFLSWLGKSKGVKLNCFDGVQHVDARGNETFERGTLTIEQAKSLLAVAPRKRGIAYALSLYTGLRRGEIEGLEWKDIKLEEKVPFLIIRASTSKNRKTATIPLHPDLVRMLSRWKEEIGEEDSRVIPDGIPQNRLGLWKDFKDSNIPRVNQYGQKIDFHALRHTACTFMQTMGGSPQVAMIFMRHSEMRLTSKVYTNALELPIAESVNKLPSLIPDKWTQKGTTFSVSKKKKLSLAVTEEKTGKVDFNQYLKGSDTDCHNISQPVKGTKMAERGGFGPPVPDLTSTAV